VLPGGRRLLEVERESEWVLYTKQQAESTLRVRCRFRLYPGGIYTPGFLRRLFSR
jgi:hypothetical protein